LLDAHVDALTIANRTLERATALADALAEPERVNTALLSSLHGLPPFHIVIDATSAGHGGIDHALPHEIITPDTVCYHLSYGKAASSFLAYARDAGARRRFDGLGMLVEQAAEAFAIWNGVRPDTSAVYAELRADSSDQATD
jgi:shikimate dehydrogenase